MYGWWQGVVLYRALTTPTHWPLPTEPDQVVSKQQYLNTIDNP